MFGIGLRGVSIVFKQRLVIKFYGTRWSTKSLVGVERGIARRKVPQFQPDPEA